MNSAKLYNELLKSCGLKKNKASEIDNRQSAESRQRCAQCYADVELLILSNLLVWRSSEPSSCRAGLMPGYEAGMIVATEQVFFDKCTFTAWWNELRGNVPYSPWPLPSKHGNVGDTNV